MRPDESMQLTTWPVKKPYWIACSTLRVAVCEEERIERIIKYAVAKFAARWPAAGPGTVGPDTPK